MIKDVMILDYDKCVRIAKGDEVLARATEPYYCKRCAREALTGEVYYDEDRNKERKTLVRYLTDQPLSGKLRFQGQKPPMCENHNPPQEMVPRWG